MSPFHFQLVSRQPHLVRSLREEQEVPRDCGGQSAAAGGPRGLETPGPEGHQVHLCPHLGRLLHPSRGKKKKTLFSRFQIRMLHVFSLTLEYLIKTSRPRRCRRFSSALTPCWPTATSCLALGRRRSPWWPKPLTCLCWCVARPTSFAKGCKRILLFLMN